MRRWSSIARATALEILSEPLSLLLLVAALVVTAFTPAFHYHQFGEATRMARDAALSALFAFPLIGGVFGAIRTFRREIETGTAQMALSHPVSHEAFFLAKVSGVLAAFALFALPLAAQALTVVRAAEIGGELAVRSGDVAKLWGPSLACAVAVVVVPLVAAAALNRFMRFRFVKTFFVWATAVALAGVCYRFNPVLARQLAPAALACLLPAPAFVVLASAAAVRLRANGAWTVVGVAFAAFLPCVGNYYLADALSRGGSPAWSYVGLAALALLPAVAAFLLLGIGFAGSRDWSDAV